LSRFHLRNALAFCLGVLGFTNPPIGKALITCTAKQVFGALRIGDTKRGAAAVAPEFPTEIGGPKGPEPVRYGDWEVKGRVSDF
jgi:hypothetical protein